eukprot:309231_1
MVDKRPIDRIDDALAQYYQDCGRNDYFDEGTGIGKFRQFAEDYELNDDDMNDELDDASPDNFLYIFIDMDPMFPLLVSSDATRDDAICQILKHCYKHGVAPPLTLNSQ